MLSSGVKAAEHRTSHPSAVAANMLTIASATPVGLHDLYGDTVTFLFERMRGSIKNVTF